MTDLFNDGLFPPFSNASEVKEALRKGTVKPAMKYEPQPNQDDVSLRKPSLNQAARVVNSLFLDSEYQGKDWEAVRLALIDQFTDLIAHTVEQSKGCEGCGVHRGSYCAKCEKAWQS